MKKIILICLLFWGIQLQSTAQSTQEIVDTLIPVPQNVVVYKDARLDALNDRPLAVRNSIAKEIHTVTKKEDKSDTPIAPPISLGNKGSGHQKIVTGSITTRSGYRVLIYNGNDRTKAMQIKTMFMSRFGGTRSYMRYNAPNFKIVVGDYADKKEALANLKRIGSVFAGAFLVPDVVTVKNIIIQ